MMHKEEIMSATIIIDKVKAFPSLDETVKQVIEVCNDPRSSLMDLSQVIQQDPMTMLNILKSANSPLYNFNSNITDIAQAVNLFGMETIKSFALSTFIQKMEHVNITPYKLNPKTLINVSQRQNAFVTSWFKGDKEALDILTLSSYIMETGKIILSDVIIESSAQRMFTTHLDDIKTQKDLVLYEKAIFDLSHEEVSAQLLKKWGFAPAIYDSIRYMNNPQNAPKAIAKYAQILQVVKIMVNTHKFDKKTSLEEAVSLVKEHNLNPKQFVSTYKRHRDLKSSVSA